MNRFLDREEERPQSSGPSSGSPGNGSRPRVAENPEDASGFGENVRERIVFKDLEYRLRPSEEASMRDLGVFRLIRAEDLLNGVYSGDEALAEADLRSLRKQGLVRTVTFQAFSEHPTRVHTLTGEGYQLALERSGGPPKFYYWGTVKPSEVQHDSLLYRAYLHQGRQIRENGGSVKRIVLDFELKRDHFSRVNKPGVDYRKEQSESARELHLPVIDGHVVFPDFRVEYEDERGEVSRVDVEVATENYRGRHLAVKMAAGFQVYAASSGGVRVHSGGPLRGNAFPQHNRVVLPL